MTQIQRQVSHNETSFAAEDVFHVIDFAPPENARYQIERKLIVSGRNRRMSCENALPPDRLNIIVCNRCSAGLSRRLIEQLDREQTGMPLVHMKTVNAFIAQSSKYFYAAYTEDRFLAKAVPLISSVKVMSQSPVPFGILRQVGVQKINWHLESSQADDFILPRANLNGPAFYNKGGSLRHLG